jgi:2-succinyl-6-hydroxy-2,4-cyclohexadiene-1-carboxylate synthase
VTTLSTRVVGKGQPLAFVHGFTQTKDSWLPLVTALSTPIQATLIDAPDHGESTCSLTLTETAQALAETADGNTLVGYSMGARMSLMAAVESPQSFPRLILISGTAGLDTDEERHQRRTSDEALAEHIQNIGVAEFINEWLSNPLFEGLSRENARIEDRITNSARGLASSLRLCGTGTQPPLWNRLETLSMPILLIAGEKDQKFCALAQRMHALLPNSELHIHPRVGHTVHLEDATGCASVIDKWLLRTER